MASLLSWPQSLPDGLTDEMAFDLCPRGDYLVDLLCQMYATGKIAVGHLAAAARAVAEVGTRLVPRADGLGHKLVEHLLGMGASTAGDPVGDPEVAHHAESIERVAREATFAMAQSCEDRRARALANLSVAEAARIAARLSCPAHGKAPEDAAQMAKRACALLSEATTYALFSSGESATRVEPEMIYGAVATIQAEMADAIRAAVPWPVFARALGIDGVDRAV